MAVVLRLACAVRLARIEREECIRKTELALIELLQHIGDHLVLIKLLAINEVNFPEHKILNLHNL